MISINIKNIDNFMHALFIDKDFDRFLVKDLEISTANNFAINGRINQNFYNTEELDEISEDFVFWSAMKPLCCQIIKGNKLPLKMKFILAAPKATYEKIVIDSNTTLSSKDIGGLYIHILYENNQLNIITGTSINVFSLDKTIDKYWDNLILKFLSGKFEINQL